MGMSVVVLESAEYVVKMSVVSFAYIVSLVLQFSGLLRRIVAARMMPTPRKTVPASKKSPRHTKILILERQNLLLESYTG